MSSIDFRSFLPGDLPVKDFHQFLLGAVAPRPIAFVSTVNEEGQPNLAPYSFFNAFSSNPPTVVFSSNRRVAGNTTKDTLHNVEKTGECVINAVCYQIVRQMALASVEFPSGESEFEKTGLTPIPSDLVKPFRVMESPAQMECKVKEIITLGQSGGAGHLVICEVLKMHVSNSVIDENDRIDPQKIDLMGRMGRAFYVRASGESVFPITQSVTDKPIGYEGLPEAARSSNELTANQIATLAALEYLPSLSEAKTILESHRDANKLLKAPHTANDLLKLIPLELNLDDEWKKLCAAILVVADQMAGH